MDLRGNPKAPLRFNPHEQLPEFGGRPRQGKDRHVEHEHRFVVRAGEHDDDAERDAQRDDDLADEAPNQERFVR
jgi:hypothetical protein